MRSKIFLCVTSAAVVSLFSACKEKDSAGNKNLSSDNLGATPSSEEEATGCFQGIVTNGLTGERVALSDDLSQKLFVVTPSRVVGAKPLSTQIGGQYKEQLTGEFSVCNVPVGASFPIYVKLDGYQAYYVDGATVVANSTRQIPMANGQSISKFYYTPVTARNFKVYPLNQLVGDYKIVVNYRGAAVEGATVRIAPKSVGNNTIGGGVSISGETRNSLGNAMSAATDASGSVSFKADKLTFGGEYQVYVYSSKITDATGQFGSNFSISRSFIVGQATDVPTVDSAFDNDPFKTTIELSEAATNKLEITNASGRALSGATPVLLPDADAKIVFTFNRDIELASNFDPDSLFGITVQNYGIKDVNTACTATDFAFATPPIGAANATTEAFTATVTGNTLTVTPKFADDAKWAGAKNSCRGIKIRYVLNTSAVRAKDLPGLTLTGAAANYDLLVTKE